MPANGHKTRIAAPLLLALLAFAPIAAFADDTGGFGDGIPLKEAAKGIVPAGYNVELGAGVDPAKPVSWKKTDGWKKAIAAAAGSGGYVVTYSGQVVKIVKVGGANVQKADESTAAPAPTPSADPASHPAGATMVRHDHYVVVQRHVHHVHVVRSEPSERSSDPAMSGPSVTASGFVILPEHGDAPRDGWHSMHGTDRGPGADVAVGGFEAHAGENLAYVLEQWANREGWRVEWTSNYVYKLNASARYSGDFQTAAEELVRSMANIRPQVTADFYKGNKVLVIGNRGLDEAASN